MDSEERVELSEEMHRKGLQFYTFQPTSMGYEGALMDLWNGKLSYDEFRYKVKDLKELNTDWYDLLFRTSVSHQHAGQRITRITISLSVTRMTRV